MRSSEFRSLATKYLGLIRPSTTFLTVKNYQNNFTEVSDFSVCFHISYRNALLKSKKTLEDFRATAEFCKGKGFSLAELRIGKAELIDSYNDSLSGYNPRYTCHEVYDQIVNETGESIPGIKLHHDQDIIHLEGYVVHKLVHKPGIYPIRHPYPLTLAKDALRELTPLDKWRQWKLTAGKFETLKIEKMELLPEDFRRGKL